MVTGFSTSAFESGFIAMALQSSAYLAEWRAQASRRSRRANGMPPTRWACRGPGSGLMSCCRRRSRLSCRRLPILRSAISRLAPVLALLSVGELTGVATRISNYTFKPIETFTTSRSFICRSVSLELNDVPAGKGLSGRSRAKDVVRHLVALAKPSVLAIGVWMTLALVIVSLAIGVVIGLIICAGMLLGRGIAYYMSAGYVALFRALAGTGHHFLALLLRPFILNTKLSAFEAGTIALAIPTGAYLAEIFRAGIEAVPRGQFEAARAVGLSPVSVVWDVVAPQALRMMIPPMLGITTILIKNSALVSAIGVGELFYQAMVLGGQTLRYFEFLTAIAIHVLRPDFAAEPPGSTPKNAACWERSGERTNGQPRSERSSEPMIACEGVRKSFGAFEAFEASTSRWRVARCFASSALLAAANRPCCAPSTRSNRSTRAASGSTTSHLPASRREILKLRRKVGMVFQASTCFRT